MNWLFFKLNQDTIFDNRTLVHIFAVWLHQIIFLLVNYRIRWNAPFRASKKYVCIDFWILIYKALWRKIIGRANELQKRRTKTSQSTLLFQNILVNCSSQRPVILWSILYAYILPPDYSPATMLVRKISCLEFCNASVVQAGFYLLGSGACPTDIFKVLLKNMFQRWKSFECCSLRGNHIITRPKFMFALRFLFTLVLYSSRTLLWQR